jgi:hypothetical protein
MLPRAAVTSADTIFMLVRRKLPFACFMVDCPFLPFASDVPEGLAATRKRPEK